MPRLTPFLSLTLLLLSGTASADTLTLPPPENAATSGTVVSVTLPGRGMSMDQVEAKFGPPRERMPSVGEPPITRWVYDDFTVYFEYEYVINAVPNVGMPKPAAPAPAAEAAPAEPAAEPAPAIPAPEAPANGG